jgi:hypothetical protein
MRAKQNTLARALHDVGLAAWFGGALMGAVGLNGASREVRDPAERTRVANSGWGRWTPVSLAAITLHYLGLVQLAQANKSRLAAQQGVGTATFVKAGLGTAAMATTVYARLLGQKVMEAEADAAQRGDELPTAAATTPAQATPYDVRQVQRQLRVAQWAVPALTGAVLIADAKLSEQQRPMVTGKGLLKRLTPDRWSG